MERDEITILEEIGRIAANSSGPQSTLKQIVRLIADNYETDVCSVYLLESDMKNLVLKATVGLSENSVERVRMRIDEGLTGLTLEKMEPVFIVNPFDHPRYKFFKESGEEIYKTFLGIPLIYHQKPLGVLVLQTVSEKTLSKSNIRIFAAIASQISAAVAYSGLLESLKKDREESLDLKEKFSEIKEKNSTVKSNKKGFIQGIPVSAGFAEGYAYYLSESIDFAQVKYEETDDPKSEIEKLQTAFEDSKQEITLVKDGLNDLATQDQAIFEAHLMVLRDEGFKNKIIDCIDKGLCAASALKHVITKYVAFFANMEDSYLKQRGSDIEDIGKRVLRNLLGVNREKIKKFIKKRVIIASDISPVELVEMRQDNLKAIILSRGGKTSHAVILAKSYEIPTVIGVKDILESVKENDFLIVDGTSGLIFSKPSQPVIEEYTRLKAEKNIQNKKLTILKDLEAKTKDEYTIKMGGNIGMLSDLELVKKYGADHIGLYRTEFPFLARKEFPSEEDQFLLYKKIVQGAEGRSITIRSLDVGGDKFLSYLDYPKEKNPYLGWRSIRVSLETEEIFKAQIRAILRASHFGRVNMLFPMITSVNEVRKIVNIVNDEKLSLEITGIPFDKNIKIGIMAEVPGMVKILDKLLKYIDFISIGTNDLIQYTLAVDRNNEKVASLYNPLHPGVIATINEIISICRKNNKEVSICGETASNPLCAYLFLGMQVTALSMNPSSIPIIKNMIKKVSFLDAKKSLKKVLDMEDADEIMNFLNKTVPLIL
ncbi:phosphotransferase system, enzyme I, PtsP [Candidatus Magnetomoraceae bacterium gMMP-1]